ILPILYIDANSDSMSPRLRQQLFNLLAGDSLIARPLPVEFAVPPVAQPALAVDHVDARPDAVCPGLPHLLLVVDGDGEGQLVFRQRRPQLLAVLLCSEFGSVDSDENDVLSLIGLLPLAIPGVVVHAV